MKKQDKKNFFDSLKLFFHKRKEKARKKEEARKKLSTGETIVSFVKTVVGALVLVMFLHSLLIASFVVPTGSMENTVMTGDFLLVNKIYGASTPQIIPFLNIPLPYKILFSISDPERGDVIVFVFPGNRDEVEASEFQYYLKRCVALPGDTVRIIDNKLYVNNELQPIAKNAIFDNRVLSDKMEALVTFPRGLNFLHDNYGPLRVPKKGDTVFINSSNYYQWDVFIQREGHSISLSGNTIKIDDKITNQYIVEQDYYFGMGDNRDHSSDSRYWGFIPRENILGSPIICWFSWEMRDHYGNEYSLLEKFTKIRWERMFRTID